MTDGRKTCALWMILMLIAVCASGERKANGEDAKVNPKDSKSERPRALDESSRIAELIKRIELVNNPTNTTSKESDLFEESILFTDLITRADLAFEASEPNSINLMEPRRVRWMPIAELDRMLTNGAVQKELAVVVIGQWSGRVFTKEEAKMIEEFASEVREGEVMQQLLGEAGVEFESRALREFVYRVKEAEVQKLFGETMGEFAARIDKKLCKAGFRQVVFANKYNGMYRRMRVGRTPTEERAQREKAYLNSSSTNSLPHVPDK
jgi:hypothetical protein